MEHRLAAIMITDVVGYSRLMETDEAGTLERLKDWRSAVLEPIVQAHKGRLIKVMGDGTLIELPSALNAVQCALDLQRRMTETAAANHGPAGFSLRIGINIGDVIGDGGDVYGDGVNVAARLEPLAEPGGICISGKVYEEVRGKLAIAFEDLGEVALKNITRPVQAYRLRDGATADATAQPQSKLTVPDRPSLVVLPFQNMSGDAEAGVFRRRHGGGYHHRAVAHPLALRHRPQLEPLPTRAGQST